MIATLEKKPSVSVRASDFVRKKVSFFSGARKKKYSSSENPIQLDEWKISGIKKGIDSLQKGKGIKGEIAMKWFNELGTNKEIAMPHSL